jgi:ribosomal protein S18 acetylase RimI-like enzyme
MPNLLTTIPQSWADPIFTAQQAATLLAQPHHILLAIQAGQGGHLLARIMPHTPADLLTLYVPENCRNQGHAKQLMHALLIHAQAAPCPALTLEVRASNTAAITLYTALGLQILTRRSAYYTNPAEDAVVMQLEIIH